ncbi:MAG TPA: hypothetical protein VMT76_00955 [Puia sp.]|nr:hypothetical protein [Puia sp.]
MRKCKYCFFILPFFLHPGSFAQSPVLDNDSTCAGLNNTIGLYYSAIQSNAHLYNGRQYSGYNANYIGHPYFDTAVLQKGSIYYDGTLYNNILLQYDINKNEVITEKYGQELRLSLSNEKIDSFRILNNEFLKIIPDSNAGNIMEAGFYQRLYHGKTEVLVKRKKIIRDDPVTNGELKSRYIPVNNYYVRKNGAYIKVDNKKSLLKVFQDKNKELARYLKSKKLKYKKDPELTIEKAAAYYDLLTS